LIYDSPVVVGKPKLAVRNGFVELITLAYAAADV
jgi:hypothetical protein